MIQPVIQLPAAAPWLLSGSASVAAANCSRLQPEDHSKWDSPAIVATPMHVKICVYVYTCIVKMYVNICKPIYVQYSVQTKSKNTLA